MCTHIPTHIYVQTTWKVNFASDDPFNLKLSNITMSYFLPSYCTFLFRSFSSYHNFSSLQWGFSNPAESNFTPESFSLFHERFSSLRCEGFDVITDARAAQPSSVTSQLLKLRKTQRSQGGMYYQILIVTLNHVTMMKVCFRYPFSANSKKKKKIIIKKKKIYISSSASAWTCTCSSTFLILHTLNVSTHVRHINNCTN